MLWFLFSLLGFAALRLHPLYPPIKQGISWFLGGETRYRLLVTTLTFLSLFGVAFFYNIPRTSLLWGPTLWMYRSANVAIFFSCVGLVALFHPCNIRRYVFSLPLCVALLWALPHLMATGDTTSCILFMGLALIALAESLLLYVPPRYSSVAWSNDVAVVFLAFLLFMALLLGHEYYSGVAVVV